MKQTISGVDYKKFQFLFPQYVGHSGSYLTDRRSLPQSVCGYMDRNNFAIWQNIGIRNFKTLTCGVLRGEIKEDGSLVYHFKKRIDGFVLLIAMAVMSIIIGAIISVEFSNIFLLLPFAAIALLNIFFAFRHSPKDRNQLIGVLNHILHEISEES